MDRAGAQRQTRGLVILRLDLAAWARLCPAGDEDDEQVSGSLRLPTEALAQLVTGRLDPAHTPAGTTAEGRPSLDELRRLYHGHRSARGDIGQSGPRRIFER